MSRPLRNFASLNREHARDAGVTLVQLTERR
jgi:hypothetical protein